MEQVKEFENFSLLGGPLHRLGRRLGLVRGATNTVPLGLALGLFLWAVLAGLALMNGKGHQAFSLSGLEAHVRLLVVVPLFFLCEAVLDPRVPVFLGMIVRSGVVRKSAMSPLESEIVRVSRWRDSWFPEAVCLLAAVLLSVLGSQLHLSGPAVSMGPGHAMGELPMAGRWYWVVCLPLFRFLMLRWLWRLGLWTYFLWRVAKLDLHLVPTHPDGAAGLGYLEVVHNHFAPLILAFSAIQASSLAEGIATGSAPFEAIYPALAIVLLADVVLFLGPLFLFTPKLWACRVKGLSDYMAFAKEYVSDFDGKWLGADDARGEPLLGTADLQSLADLSNSVNIVRNMRMVPVSLKMLKIFVVAAVLPMVPLLLLKYPVAELAQKFLGRLTGL